MSATALIFLFTYAVFSIGRVPGLRSDRLAAAILGATLMLAVRAVTPAQAQASVDGSTLALLFGMMVLAAALEVSGGFALVGWWATRRAHSPMALLITVTVTSAVLSAFLINDVVCIAFTPLVLTVCEALGCDPRPHLVGLATASNIGSAATITGNPQNILIGSLSHIPYARFVSMLAPVSLIALAVDVWIIVLVYRHALTQPFRGSAVERRPRTFQPLVRKASIVAVAVLAAFIAGVPPAVAAMLGASAMLLTKSVKPQRFYGHIDWQLLALFAGLFVVVGGVEQTGLAERLFQGLRFLHPQSVWGLTALSAILSNVVSNVPAVMVLKSLVPRLPHPETAWLTLAMASTFAGNLTLPGSLATIIVVERARGRAEIGFVEFLKVGAPTALLSLLLGAAWLALRG